MTDFTSREVVYYTADMYNNTSADIEAQIDVSLQYPLVQQGNNYNVGISKAQFDLSTIPLTRTNIPLRKFEVSLRNGQSEGSAFVRQVNASSNNFSYNLDPATREFSKSTYDSTGLFTEISSFIIPSNIATKFGAMVLDNYENVFLATNTNGSSIFDTLTILSPTGAVISQSSGPLSNNSIVALSMNPDQILCIASNDFNRSQVSVLQVTSAVGIVTITPLETLLVNKAGIPLTDIRTVAIDTSHILIGYNAKDCTLYDAQTLAALNDFQVSEITSMGSASAILSSSNRFVLVDTNAGSDYLYGFGNPTNNIINTDGTVLKAAGVLDLPSLSNVVYSSPTSGTVYGVKSNAIYSVPYTDGALGTPTSISTGPVVSVGVDAWNSIYGIDGANLKYLNLNGVSPGITQVACSDIQVGGASTQVFFQPGSNTAYAISGGNLYTSNQVAPKLIFSSSRLGGINTIDKYYIPAIVDNSSVAPSLLEQYEITIAGEPYQLQCNGICKQSGTGIQPYFSLYSRASDSQPNVLYGLPFDGGSSLQNQFTAQPFTNGLWSPRTGVPISPTTGLGLGVSYGFDNVLSFTYNFTTGATTVPTAYNTTQGTVSISNSVQNDNFTAIFAQTKVSGEPQLLGTLNADNGTTNKWFTTLQNPYVDIPNQTSIVSWVYQESTGNMLAVGSDGNLWKATLGPAPKMIIEVGYFSAVQSIAVQPVGINTAGGNNAYVNYGARQIVVPDIGTGATISQSFASGFYYFASVFFSNLPSAGTWKVYRYDMRDWSANPNIYEMSFLTVQPTDASFCEVIVSGVSTGWAMVTNGADLSGTSVATLYIGSQSTNTLTSTYQFPSNLNYTSTTMTVASASTTSVTSALVVTSSVGNISFWNIADPANITAIYNFSSGTEVQATIWPNDQNNTFYVVQNGVTNQDVVKVIMPSNLASGPIDATAISNVTTTETISASYNSDLGEIYVAKSAPFATIQAINTTLNPPAVTSVITLNNVETDTISQWTVAQSADYITQFQQMTFTGTTANLKSISIDPVSNGTLFVTDALGAVLQGDISGNSIAFSPVEGISQTYDTVNVVPIHDQSYLLKHNDPTDFTQFSSTLIDANTSGVFEIEGMGMGVVLSNGINTNINIYDYNLNALVTGSAIQIAQSTASASSWTVGANKFVLIAGGTTFYVYNVTNTASVQLVSTQNVSTVITGLQQGQTLQEINNVVCFLSGSSSGFFIGTSNLSTTGYPDLFGSFTYTNTTFSTLSGASVIYTGYQYRTESNNIPVNKSLGEVYLQTHGSGLQNQVTYGVLIYNYSAQDISCTISTVTLNNMFVPEVIDGTFAWQQKTFTPEQAISSLCFSQTNPNKMYVVDSDDNLLYQTNVNLPAPYVSTRVLNTPDEMSSVSSGLPTLTNVNSTAYCYNLQGGQTLIGSFNVQNAPILAIGKDRVSYNGQGEFILSSYHNEVVSLAPSGFASQWVVTPFDTAGFIYVKPGEDLYAGDVSIYDYETLVRNINQAFAEAYGYLVSDGGQGMIGPPVISLDPVTSKLTLTYAAPYSEAGNGILFNNSMLQLCKFSSTPDTIDPGMNLLLLPEASTSLTQISRSIYIFNQLDQILLVSNTIFVIGSLYGNNLQNNILQDFSVPISDQPGNQGVVLYVQPNFVSTLTIGSNQAIQRIQLRVLYKYKDETTYPLLLAPNSNWTAKMMFIKKY